MSIFKKNWQLVLIGIATLLLGIIAVVTALKLYQAGQKPVAPTAPKPAPAITCAIKGEVCSGFAGSLCCESLVCVTEGGLPADPDKGGICQEGGASKACTLTFTVLAAETTPTPTGTLVPTSTPGPTATPTPKLGCDKACSSDSDCEGDLRCQTVSGTKMCVNLNCSGETDCICNKNCWEVCGQNSECPSSLTCRSIDGTYRCVNPSCERKTNCSCSPAAGPTATPTITPTPKPTATPTPVAPALPQAGTILPTFGLIIGAFILIGLAAVLAL